MASVLAGALRASGDDARTVGGSTFGPLERRLSRRGYERGLAGLPALCLALARSDFDVVHAFAPLEGLVAARWAQRRRRLAVLCLTERVDRRWLVERRMRLEATVHAIRQCAAVLVPDPPSAESLHQALGIDPIVIEQSSGPAHHALYEQLLGSLARLPG